MPRLSRRSQLLAAALIASSAPNAVAAPLFQAGSFGYHVPNYSYQTVLADLDDDGILDIATVNRYPSNKVTLLRGQGDGTFMAADSLAAPYADALVLADMNLDGKMDLLTNGLALTSVRLGNGDFTFAPQLDFTLGYGSSGGYGLAVGNITSDSLPDVIARDTTNALVVWAGTGGGALTAIQTLPISGSSVQFNLADLDHDDDLDIVAQKSLFVTPNYFYSLLVFLNNGLGTFAPGVEYSGDTSYGMDVADFDEDGNPDIALGGNWFPGDGTGQFGAAVAYGSNERFPRLADINQDGILDVLTHALTAAITVAASSEVRVRLGLGGGSFGPLTLWPTALYPTDFDVADLTSDGHPDLVVTGYTTGTLSIHVGDGQGGFAPTRSFNAGGSVSRVEIADLSEDGLGDVLALSPSQNLLRVLQGLGGGALGSPSDYSIAAGARDLAVGDLDADGRLDVAVTSGSGFVSVLPGQGGGMLGPPTHYPTVLPAAGIAIGDVTGDGRPDLVTTRTSTLSVFPGQAGAGLGARADYSFSPSGLVPNWIQIGDVTGDTRPDVVVIGPIGSEPNRAECRVFPGLANGSLGAPIGTDLGATSDSPARSAVLADTDFDGKLDLHLAWGNYANARLRRCLGAGNGTFGAGVNTIVGKDGSKFEIADVTGDGRPDLLIAEGWSRGVAVCPLNADGSFAEGLYFGAPSYTTDLAVGDLDGDSQPDIATADIMNQTVTVLLRRNVSAVGVPERNTPVGRAGIVLARAWPTIARAAVHLSFTLPARGETVAELFDLEGRRLQKRNLGVLEAGANECSVHLSPSMAPGVTWLRLRQGASSVAAKVVVAR